MSRVVLITGGSRGIGAATVRAFAENGDRVIFNYLNNEDKAEVLENTLKSRKFNVKAFRADVSNENEVVELFEKIKKEYGIVDILVNNAGVCLYKQINDTTEADWDRLISVNLKGAFNCCRAAVDGMISKKSGKIINVSSVWGITGASMEVCYSASKAGIIGMTKALAKELAPSNINVNCVAPGVIDTDMNSNLTENDLNALKDEIPLGRLGSADEVAKLIKFLASADADYITGQCINICGGFVI